jgi:tripartite-type tricarboxylate transporter receptor subunit TctC
MITIKGTLRWLNVAIFAALPLAALTQNYPTKPRRMVLPFPPGGASDVIARGVGTKLTETLGQPVIVDNRGGAGGAIGTEIVARAPADGYTILLGNGQTHILITFLMKNLPYDPQKDFTPITWAARIVIALAVHPSLPASTLKEFIDYAKRNPGKLSYATPGVGSPHQLAGEMLKEAAGFDMVHIPYKGGGPAMSDVVAGQVPATIASLSTAVPFMQAGKVRVLTVFQPERDSTAPDVPSVNDTLPSLGTPVNFIGFFGPAGLPAPILSRLHTEIVKAINAPDLRSAFEKVGLAVKTSSPEQFAADIRAQAAEAAKVIKAIGLKPE